MQPSTKSVKYPNNQQPGVRGAFEEKPAVMTGWPVVNEYNNVAARFADCLKNRGENVKLTDALKSFSERNVIKAEEYAVVESRKIVNKDERIDFLENQVRRDKQTIRECCDDLSSRQQIIDTQNQKLALKDRMLGDSEEALRRIQYMQGMEIQMLQTNYESKRNYESQLIDVQKKQLQMKDLYIDTLKKSLRKKTSI